MIVQARARHNAAAIAILAALLPLGACNGARDHAGSAPAHRSTACPLVVDTSGLRSFYALAGRSFAAADLVATVAEEPVWNRWRRSFAPDVVSPEEFGLAWKASLQGMPALTPQESRKSLPRDMIRAQSFALAARERIEPFVAAYVTEEAGCEAWALIEAWIPASSRPDTLRLDFLAANAEIRLFEDHHMIDAGLALACGRDQLARMLTSVLYRDRCALPGLPPGEAQGEAVVAESLRIVRNEGIAAYIDDLPGLYFGREHPLLGGAAPIPEDLCELATRNLANIEMSVADQLARPDSVRTFEPVYLYLAGSGGWQATGWFMASLIAERQGLAALQALANRPLAEFVQAYQDAALANPARATASRGSVAWYRETAPVYSPPVLAMLLRAIAAQASG